MENATLGIRQDAERFASAGVWRDVRAAAGRSISRQRFWSRQGAFALADQATLSIGTLCLNVVLARALQPQDYGAFSLAFSIFLFIAGFHNALLLEPLSVLGPARYAGDLRGYFTYALRLNRRMTAGLAGAALVIAMVTALTSSLRVLAGALTGLALASPLVLRYWLVRRLHYVRQDPAGACARSIGFVLTLGAGLALFGAAGMLSPFSAFMALGFAGLLAGSRSRRHTGSAQAEPFDCGPLGAVWKEHWRYGRWILAASLVYWISSELYYSLAAGLLGLEKAGALRALQNMTSPAVSAMAALGSLLLPWFAGEVAVRGGQALRRGALRVSLTLGGLALLYAGALSALRLPIINLLYGGRYREDAWLVPYFAAVPVVIGLASGYQILLRAVERPQGIFQAYAGSAAATLVAGVALVRGLGLLGAALGLLTSFGVYLLALVRLTREATGAAEAGYGA